MSRVPRDATAFDQRDSNYNFVIISRWTDPSQAQAQRRVGARDVGGGEAVHEWARVRELHRRGRGAGSRARGVRCGQVRAARGDQAKV